MKRCWHLMNWQRLLRIKKQGFQTNLEDWQSLLKDAKLNWNPINKKTEKLKKDKRNKRKKDLRSIIVKERSIYKIRRIWKLNVFFAICTIFYDQRYFLLLARTGELRCIISRMLQQAFVTGNSRSIRMKIIEIGSLITLIAKLDYQLIPWYVCTWSNLFIPYF